jgi:DNA-binding MarR family transcriptional regulator
MRIEAPTLVRHLDKLEEQALVERRRDERDRRIVRVYPTPDGCARFEEFHAVVLEADAELHDALGERDASELRRVLAKVEQHYGVEAVGTVKPVPGRNGSHDVQREGTKT